MKTHILKLFAGASIAAMAASGVAAETKLLRQGAISEDAIAFTYGGDIWVADRDGGNPRQLTTRDAPEMRPSFSPDGQTIAFSATYDGNTDVYTIPTKGGVPKRLTWHPGADTVNGWTPDGKTVLFTSRREQLSGRSAQAWHVPASGGFPQKVMEAVVQDAAWGPDGATLAYQPYLPAHRGASGWRNHRGGSTPPIWVFNPTSGELAEVPHERASDTNPMWVGEDVFFLSDRNGMKNIWRYDTSGKTVSMSTDQKDWDINYARAYGDSILFTTTSGELKELNTRNGNIKNIEVTLNATVPQARKQWKDASRNLTNYSLSPTGKRAVLTARGEVFTVPLKDGSTRNLTRSSGAKEVSALWSPKGDQIAYISDTDRKWKLVLTNQNGAINSEIVLGDDDYALLDWSSDGDTILYTDNHLTVRTVDLGTGSKTKIFTNERRANQSAVFSPDGKWIAYTKSRANFFNDVFLFERSSGSHTRVSDGMSHASAPVFSRDGAYLYFGASTNAGPTSVGLDMTTQERPRRFGLYAAVLAADGKSPLLPKAGDEEIKAEPEDGDKKGGNKDKKAEDKKAVSVDVNGLQDRVVALPVAERFYTNLSVAADGSLMFIDNPQAGASIEPNGRPPRGGNLMRFDFEDKKAASLMKGVNDFALSADGKTVIARKGGNALVTAKAGKKLEAKPLSTKDVKAFINPRKEWAQIFDEVWRVEKQYFYDPNMHGIDWDGIYAKYQPLVAHVATRAELTRLLVDMISELQVGHNRSGGGDVYRDTPVSIGLLGATLRLDDNRYRVDRIFTGENWNPFLKAPLAAPGIGVKAGDYIHAVNGAAVDGSANIYAQFVGTVGKQVTLSVSSSGNSADARDVVVEPIANDFQLRRWAWVENNRKLVDEASGGKVGYVYLPNTAGGGFTYFNRMFFAQSDRPAMIIDERMNGGGQAANYITDVLARQYLSGWKDRDGLTFDTPGGGVFGPKVMLIDQDAGSGGDFLPYSFRRMGIGTLIGKRTWGGLIGISANPQLIDGGFVTVPFFRFYTPDDEWRVENEGVAPDIDVMLDPRAVNAGRDTQLERALQEVQKQLESHKPVKRPDAPPFPTKLGG